MSDGYTIQRSARRTISIVIKDGAVIVKVPNEYDSSPRLRQHVEDFLRRKSGWIERKLSETARNREELLPGLGGNAVYLFGYPAEVLYDPASRATRFDGRTLRLPVAHDDAGKRLILARWYKKIANKELSSRLRRMADTTGYTYASFALSSAKGKWGSCADDGVIRLNYRLAALPERLIDYVILHELCHTAEMNHSEKFWKRVGYFMPDCKARRKELDRYRFVMELI